mmetsp:Transcript_24293/g.59493  ORF Transcript_24293/g.59493 Transcript_24293/m.59493 type:complete len:84 (+) Transcript_24293:331-582(+)
MLAPVIFTVEKGSDRPKLFEMLSAAFFTGNQNWHVKKTNTFVQCNKSNSTKMLGDDSKLSIGDVGTLLAQVEHFPLKTQRHLF